MAAGWAIVLLLGAALSGAAPASAETLHLSGGTDLVIGFDEQAQTATVAVSGTSIGIGNALEPLAPQSLTFCSGCPTSYLVVISDASSTYGAETGIIVWPRGPVPWWSLAIVPLDQFSIVEAKPELSQIEDMATHERYSFRDGFFVKAK